MENNNLLDEQAHYKEPSDNIYTNLATVDSYHNQAKHVSHLSKLYFFMIIGGTLLTIGTGIWVLVNYSKNTGMAFSEYMNDWKFLAAMGITFALSVLVTLWFWRQFDYYSKALETYVSVPTTESFEFMQVKREKLWFLVQVVYAVYALMYLAQLFFPTTVQSLPHQANL